VERSKSTEALSILGALSGAVARANLLEVAAPTFGDLDLDFADEDGAPATGTSYITKYFTIAIGDGVVTATRKPSGYVITKNVTSGQVTCVTGTDPDIPCSNLGLNEPS